MQKRMHEIAELEHGESAGLTASTHSSGGYDDEPELMAAAEFLREDRDDISLREAWDDSYQDESSSGSRSGGGSVDPSRDPSPLPRR